MICKNSGSEILHSVQNDNNSIGLLVFCISDIASIISPRLCGLFLFEISYQKTRVPRFFCFRKSIRFKYI